jgi:C4-dicarboxylate transporter DctM subunit
MTALLIAAAALLLLGIGAPLFIAVAVATLGCLQFLGDGLLTAMIADMFNAVNKEVLLAIPFFVFAGALMTEGGIARRIIDVARALTGWLPGGMAITTILACLFFAAISGSSPVTVIAIGSMMLPALLKEGYREGFSLGLVTSAGSLGILIPPSIPMIVYAIMVSNSRNPLSVADLFLGGIGPGMVIGAILAAHAFFQGTRGQGTRQPFSMAALCQSTRAGIFALALPLLILGGIYGGWFTATEASALAVAYALVVAVVIHRELPLTALPRLAAEAGVVMGSLFLILVTAMAFNQFLTLEQLPQEAATWVTGHVHSRLSFLFLANLFLLALGCVMDILSAILIVAPLLAPIAAGYGIHPIHFGIIFIVNLEIGYLTPPLGLNLFVASTCFERPITTVVRAAAPFTLLLLLGLALVTYLPAISLLFVGHGG